MTEKRFEYIDDDLEPLCKDNENDGEVIHWKKVVDLLNEQQELIEELHISDNMGWGRAEKFEKELKQKKIYIKRLEYKVQKFKEENEQLRQQQQRLYNYFRDYLEDEMSAENFGEMWDNVKEDERWE